MSRALEIIYLTYRPKHNTKSLDRPAREITKREREFAERLLAGLKESNPRALIQGSIDDALIDGSFDLIGVAASILRAPLRRPA